MAEALISVEVSEQMSPNIESLTNSICSNARMLYSNRQPTQEIRER